MIAVGMCAYVELKVLLCHPKLMKVCNYLIFVPIVNSRSRPKRVLGVGSVWVIVVLTRIDHRKTAIAFKDNGVL